MRFGGGEIWGEVNMVLDEAASARFRLRKTSHSVIG